MLDPISGKSSWKTATLQAMVGNTNHNILSTTALCRSGWQFSQWEGGAELKHSESGEVINEIVEHAGCPWIRMSPVPSTHGVSNVEPNMNKKSGAMPIHLSPLSPAIEAELEQHRRQGHFPHHPRCVECSRGRVFKHRRRGLQNIEVEVQADFAFITKNGEVDEEDSRFRNMKVLVLTELLSGCVGFVIVSENVQQVNSDIEKWLDSFGLSSSMTSVILHTDDEKAVGDLVIKSTRKYLFQVRRAAPQQHHSIGAAERAVRKLKESLAVLRADLNKHGVDIRYSYTGLRDVVTYLALMNNHFGRAGGTDLSPLETSAGRSLSKPTVSLFGSLVIAEIPDSIRQYSPNETRSIEAAFVHPGLGTGSAVEGFLRVDGRMELRRFYARNIRTVSPLQWNHQLCQAFLIPFDIPDVPLPPLDDPELGSGPVEDSRVQSEPGGEQVDPAIGPAGYEAPPDSPWYTPTTPSYGSEHYGSEAERGEPLTSGRASSSKKKDRKRSVSFEDQQDDEPDKKKKFFTRGCPSCETGMVAPGIRHTKACQRARAEFESGPVVFQPDVDMPGDGLAQREEFRGTKRSSETEVKDLEEEIKASVDEEGDTNMDMISSIGLYWSDGGEALDFPTLTNLTSVMPATSPETFDEFITSIKFSQNSASKAEKVNLCGTDVLLWVPHEAVDDTTLVLLDPDQTFHGMQEEVANMTKCKVGEVLSALQVDQLKATCPHLRTIQVRWVTAFKSIERVRARVVAKDIKSKESARSLGCSSPTPSCEIVQILLSLAATRGWRLRALDISHAFMHSPIPRDTNIVLRMPQSISTVHGEVVFLKLWKALNGLRDASKHWLSLLTSSITRVGLWSDEYEPCCFQGQIVDGKAVLGSVVMIVYVDDILITSSSKAAEEKVVQSISSIVPTKTTGSVLPAALGGGSLQFIGRTIERPKGEECIFLSVSPKYMQSTFEEYQIKESRSVPDISTHLEKTDELSQKKLTPEAYNKFHKALGRLLWLAQTRMDLKVWLSLLGSQQSDPCHSTEVALKSILRFLKSDLNMVLRMPSKCEMLSEHAPKVSAFLHMFADASHAPYRFNRRKGISGHVVFFEKCLIRAISKQQQATSLSSCESELYSIQQTAQDSVSIGRVVARVLWGIGEISEDVETEMILESDSSSAIQLIQQTDVPKRSRHIEIRLLWLRSQLDGGKLKLKHRPGLVNMADLFTKCLGSCLFERHRRALGFEPRDIPISMMQPCFDDDEILLFQLGSRRFALVEVCCEPDSQLSVLTLKGGIPYVGVVKDVQSKPLLNKVSQLVSTWSKDGLWIHVHVSTPCSSGSPLKHLSKGDPTLSDLEWESIMKSVGGFLRLGDSRSFELPFFNGIWQRPLTQDVLNKAGITHMSQVFLCQCGVVSKAGTSVGKSLGFASSHFTFNKVLHSKFGFCSCKEHASLSEVDYASTACYPEKLARGILTAVRAAMLDP